MLRNWNSSTDEPHQVN